MDKRTGIYQGLCTETGNTSRNAGICGVQSLSGLRRTGNAGDERRHKGTEGICTERSAKSFGYHLPVNTGKCWQRCTEGHEMA